MMSILKQSINLLTKEEPWQPQLNMKRIAAIWSMLCVLLFVYAFASHIQLQRAQSEHATIKQHYQQATEKLTALSNLAAEKSTDKNSTGNFLSSMLTEVKLSSYIEGIIKQTLPKTNITQFYIQSDAQTISFQGELDSVELLPQLLNSWQQNDTLKRTKISRIQVEQFQDQKMRFKLEAQP